MSLFIFYNSYFPDRLDIIGKDYYVYRFKIHGKNLIFAVIGNTPLKKYEDTNYIQIGILSSIINEMEIVF